MTSKISAKRKVKEKLLQALVFAAAGITGMIFIGIVVYILFRGLPHVSLGLLTSKPSLLNNTVGILPNILNTLYIIFITLLIVLPLGVGAAVYLNEYAKNKRAVRLIELAAETLAGIPSIIYGLVGMLISVKLPEQVTGI